MKTQWRLACRAVLVGLWITFLPVPTGKTPSLFSDPFIRLSPVELGAVIMLMLGVLGLDLLVLAGRIRLTDQPGALEDGRDITLNLSGHDSSAQTQMARGRRRLWW
jgi:hypothetical protein